MASAEMPGASNQPVTTTPASKKQNHLVAGRRKLEEFRKKKAQVKKADDKIVGTIVVNKPTADEAHGEEIFFANGSDSYDSIGRNGKETNEVLHPDAGVNSEGAELVGGLDEGKSNDVHESLLSEGGSSANEYHKTKSSAKGSVQEIPPFLESIHASMTPAVTLHDTSSAGKYAGNPESISMSKSATSGIAGTVHEQVPWMVAMQQTEERSFLRANALSEPMLLNQDSGLSKHLEPAKDMFDGSLPTTVVHRSLQRPLFGLRTGSWHDFSLASEVSKQQTDIPALNPATSIKDERTGIVQEELIPHFRYSLAANGMKPRDFVEPHFSFAQTKESLFSDGGREALFPLRQSFQPSAAGLIPAEQTVLADKPFNSNDKGEFQLSVPESDEPLVHASPALEKDLKLVDENEGGSKRTENDDFIALEQHIDELTQEKFGLQRALDAARSLAESLSQQNSALTEDFNSQGAIITQLKADLQEKREEVTSQSLVLSSLMMERERAQQENNSAVERSRILAGEVIGLEEKVLKLRSSELKLQRELETLKSDNDSFRLHLGTLEKDRQNMQSMLEALQEDKKQLQVQLQKTSSNDGLRSSTPNSGPQVDSRDASTYTNDLGVQIKTSQTPGSVIQRHLIHPHLDKSLDHTDEASPSTPIGHSPHGSVGVGVPSAFATLSADDLRAIKSIDELLTELLAEKGALLETLEQESAKASEVQALNMELMKKLETQTQRLELAVAQNMAHGVTAAVTSSMEMEPQYSDYVDEGDEVVERVLGWIMRLFPGGSSTRQNSKVL